METIRLYVDTTNGRRQVEFTGTKLQTFTEKKPDDDTKGATETWYLTKDGRRILHIVQWVDRRDNPQYYMLRETDQPDLRPPPIGLPKPDRECPLELDDALSLSLPADWRV
jgi:hypothetical protein